MSQSLLYEVFCCSPEHWLYPELEVAIPSLWGLLLFAKQWKDDEEFKWVAIPSLWGLLLFTWSCRDYFEVHVAIPSLWGLLLFDGKVKECGAQHKVAIPSLWGLLLFRSSRKIQPVLAESQSLLYEVFCCSSTWDKARRDSQSRNPFFMRSSVVRYAPTYWAIRTVAIPSLWGLLLFPVGRGNLCPQRRNPFFMRSSVVQYLRQGS